MLRTGDARSVLSAAPAGPITPERQECIVEQLLTFINLATDVAAMTAAVATLTDIVLRHRNGGKPAK